MAERFYHYYDGDDANDGLTASSPRKLLPGQTGAVAVSAGDIINARAGVDFSGGGRLVPPVNNLTYRGYGLADNVLTITVPHPLALWIDVQIRCVREAGVHEGMWRLDGSTIDADGVVNTGTRSGVTIEDLSLRGSQVGSRHALVLASSTGNVSGFALRRFEIVGAAGRGINASTKDVLIELGRVSHTKDDNIGLNSWAANGYRAGSVDTLRYLELIEPNRATIGAADTGTAGDHLHLQPTDGLWDGSLESYGVRGVKTTAAKQATVLHATNAASKVRLRGWSVGGGGDSQFLVGHIKGRMEFDGIYARDWASESIPLFRFDAADVSPPSYAMDTGSVLRIRNVLALGAVPAFYRSVYVASAHSFDGLIEIENNTVVGANRPGSTLAVFEFWSASDLSTVGENFQLRLHNNAVVVPGKPQVKIPTGMANDARYLIAGNRFENGPFQIGSTEYADIAAIQAAHSAAAGNFADNPLLTAMGVPLPGSPLLTSGADLGYLRDIRGFQSRKHIGAYGAATLRRVNP